MATTDREALDAVWARIPDVNCKGHCTDSCGPIDASIAERRLLRERGIRLKAAPWIEIGADMPGGVDEMPASALAAVKPCPALVDGRCSVYDVRPVICRLWGAVRKMPCEWGCQPDRYLTDGEAREILLLASQVHLHG